MKKLFSLALVLFSAGGVFAQTPNPIPIIPTPKPPPPYPPKPRTPELVDIEAYYSNEALTLIFNKNLGDADIVVANLTTGDMWNNSVSGVCSTTLILSGDEGYYLISIYTDNGEYSGEFNL